MSEKYRYKAVVSLVVEVEGVLEDDGHTVIEDQIRDQAIDAAGLTFRDDEITISSISYRPIDPLYTAAVELVRVLKRTRVSQLQRHLQLGYNRAFNLMEDLEREGVVGPIKPDNGRDVLNW